MAASGGLDHQYVKVKAGRSSDDTDSATVGPTNGMEGDRLLAAEADAVRTKRRRGFCTVFIIVLAVAAAIGVGVFFLTKSTSQKAFTKSPLVFGDVFSADFTPRAYYAAWTPSSTQLVRIVQNGSVAYLEVVPAASLDGLATTPTGSRICTFPVALSNETIASFALSSDESHVLVAVNQTGVYRHSRISQYAVVAIDRTDVGRCTLVDWLHGGMALRYATWGRANNSLLYVVTGNSQIFYVPDVSQIADRFNITAVGVEGELFYGIPDWLYEEEIFATDYAVWQSPDDRHAAYTVIDETGVKAFEWTVFGEPSDAYVTQRSIRYPKAGSPNPSVRLFVTRLDGTSPSTGLLVPSHLANIDHYLMQVHWMSPSLVCGLWMDRLQQKINFAVYDVADTSGLARYELNLTTNTWWENYPMTSTADGSAIIVRMPRPDGQRYVHLAILTIPGTGSQLTREFLTNGTWEVTAVEYVAGDHVAFAATIAGTHLRQVYRVATTDRDVENPLCVTCSSGDSQSCGYNSFSFSKDQSYLLQQCLGPGVPQTILSKIQANGTASLVSTLEDNGGLVNLTSEVFIPEPEFFTIPAANNASMPAMRLRPADTDSASYPTLLYAYNGPLSQSVLATYPLSGTRGRWHTQLIGEYGFQIIVVDGRGTAHLGDVYGKAQYRQLGIVETEDQIAAARYAVKHLKADASKLAFWGWSYGGYMASMLASSGTGVYTACMAVAPVTDWRYYDTAYTERFMRLPTANDNLANYDRTSVLSRTNMFNGTHFFLIHGTADDNVHFQNTAQFVRELVQHEVDFRLQFYTDKAHSLSGLQTQKHLYRQLSNFLRLSLRVT